MLRLRRECPFALRRAGCPIQRPCSMTPTQLQPNNLRRGLHLDADRSRVEQALDEYVSMATALKDCPTRLAEAMRYSLLAGGKRLRPILVLMSAEACGAEPLQAMPAACALEMIHTYSLIHDDLPAMDDDDLRRGRPTCHRAFDEATAILAGDALLTLAFEIVVRDTRPASAAAECALILARAAGPVGMVGGQMLDLDAETRDDANLGDLERIHRCKTGALLHASVLAGAVVANANEESRAAMDRYGRAVGLAFQIVDDLLDVEGDESKMGKRVQKDSGLGKWTYPGLIGVEASRQRARHLAEEADFALTPLGARADRLRALAWDLVERDR